MKGGKKFILVDDQRANNNQTHLKIVEVYRLVDNFIFCPGAGFWFSGSESLSEDICGQPIAFESLHMYSIFQALLNLQ